MIIDAALPWDLSLRLAGEVHATRPLRVADVAAIQRFADLSDDAGFDLLASLFVEPKPDLRGMASAGKIGAMELLGIAQAFAAYFEATLAKNSLAIAAELKAAMAS